MIYFVWYPIPLAKALGVNHLVMMLIIIDVVIGPLLGLLVYKEGKKSLKFDLTIIILLQITVFGYGFYTIAKGRPSWIVYDSFTFHIIKNSDIEQEFISKAKPEFRRSPFLKPQYVALDSKIKNSVLSAQKNKLPLDYPMHYVSLENAKLRLQHGALPLSLLNKYNDEHKIEVVIKKYPQADAWIALSAPVEDMVVLINKERSEIVKIVDLRPWK